MGSSSRAFRACSSPGSIAPRVISSMPSPWCALVSLGLLASAALQDTTASRYRLWANEARQLAALIDTQMTPVLTRLWPEAKVVAVIIQNRSNPSLAKAS